MKTKRYEADGLLLEFEDVPQGEADGCRGGIIFKGGFCPYWGGVCYGKGEPFFNGGLKDISTTLLANQHSNGIVEVYEDEQVWSQQDEG